MKNAQLADMLRPQSFDEIVGQRHLFGEKGIIRRMLENDRLTNMIFYGPPGTGKTTAATIIAEKSHMAFYKLNATSASLADVKSVLEQSANVFGANGVLLYLDEIQYFNRKQQQSLLEYMEDGRITLIASTTENPRFYVYNAILSRSSVFEFKPVAPEDMIPVIEKAVRYLNQNTGMNKQMPEDVALFIAGNVGGDVRRAVVLTENAYFGAEDTISKDDVSEFQTGIFNFSEDVHFDLLSALQKSIRGSDPDAALFYAMRLLEAGDLLALCRRLQVIASEDIGLADPQAAVVTRACCCSAVDLGVPEARIPIANAVIMLATSPKSNSAEMASLAAMEDVRAGKGAEPPEHLRSPLFKGYKYPHDYENHYVKQEYLPKDLRGKKYYSFGPNKREQAAQEYWKKIKEDKH